MTKNIITVLESIPEEWTNIEVYHTTAKLLPEFKKPTIVKYAGKNANSSIWISTLQHGNESTGLHVFCEQWKQLLQENIFFPYDVYFFIANGYAALSGEHWSKRFASFQVDNNRCWFREEEENLIAKMNIPSLQQKQIRLVTEFINSTNPTHLLDVHDTTGKNQSIGFTLRKNDDPKNNVLYSLAKNIIFLSRLPGSFLDAFSEKYISFGVECGKSGTTESFQSGRKMVWSFLNLSSTKKESESGYENLRRIVIKNEIDFDFHNFSKSNPIQDNRLHIRSDIEELNQSCTRTFGMLGTYFGDNLPLCVLEQGRDVTEQYLRKENGKIYARTSYFGQLFSTNKQNVIDSELGYFSSRIK